MRRLILPFILLLTACEYHHVLPSEMLNSSDGMIFGFEGGWCAGATFWKLQDQSLFKGTTKGCYNGEVIAFQPVSTFNHAYALAKPVRDNFPSWLWDHPNTVQGCPNCADQGTIWLTVIRNGVATTWRIDPQTENIPVEIRGYAQQVQSVIGQL